MNRETSGPTFEDTNTQAQNHVTGCINSEEALYVDELTVFTTTT
jgi:hypothetical protein